MTASDGIRDLELRIQLKEARRDELVKDLNAIEKGIVAEIESLWQDTKDPSLSNAQKRSAEVEARMKSCPEAAALGDERSELEIDLKRLRIDVSFLRREFRREMIRRQEALAGIGRDI